MAELFDVFLCHNGQDKPVVREIAQRLVKAGIKPWLDEEQIRPGTSWQKALGQQIEIMKSAAVFVGKNQPLSSEEVSKFLDAGGSKLAALREAVDKDPDLEEQAKTPLMLSIMSLALQGADITNCPRIMGIQRMSSKSKSSASTLNRCSNEREQLPSCFQKRRSSVGSHGWLRR
jgi:hypothetical protein